MRLRDAFTYGSVSAVVLSLLLWAPGAGPTRAGGPPPEASPSVRRSASHLTSVPVYQLFPPSVLRRLADRAHQSFWRLPKERTWPMHPDGDPIVETEQLDRLAHTVEPGQNLEEIKDDFRVSTDELRRWNPGVDLEELNSGRELVVWKRDPDAHPVSSGDSDWGRLYHGEPLPADDDYVILFQHRTFGTHYTVSEVQRVLETFYREYPQSRPLMIGDISFRGGGRMYPHVSHRTGRDVDISYPRLDEPRNYESFHYVHRDELDTEKTLFLIRKLLRGGYVEYIFMDFWFQRKLYRLAEKKGAPQNWLNRVFSYPDWGSTAIIQHEPGHRNHMHIRFHCQPTDRNCG